jgi:hypothetical protein
MVKPLKHRKDDLFCVRCKKIKASYEVFFDVKFPDKIDRNIMICCQNCRNNTVKKMKESYAIVVNQTINSQIVVGPVKIRPLGLVKINSTFH